MYSELDDNDLKKAIFPSDPSKDFPLLWYSEKHLVHREPSCELAKSPIWAAAALYTSGLQAVSDCANLKILSLFQDDTTPLGHHDLGRGAKIIFFCLFERKTLSRAPTILV